jgi:hypothetical protein
MFKHLIAGLSCAILSSAASAQQYGTVAQFSAMISASDYFNSSGARVTGVGPVLQQDRANVHRFGIVNSGDDIDWLFRDSATRARIPALYANGGGSEQVDRMIARGETFTVTVLVCGYGNNPTSLYLIYNNFPDYGCN